MEKLTRVERRQRREAFNALITQKTKRFFEAEKVKVFSLTLDLFANEENEYAYYLFLKRMRKDLPVEVAVDENVLEKSKHLTLESLLIAVIAEFNILYGKQLAELTKKFAEKEAFDAIGYANLPRDFYKFTKDQRKEYLCNEFRRYVFYELAEEIAKCFSGGLNQAKLKKVIEKLKKMSENERELFFKFFKLSLLVLIGPEGINEADKVVGDLKYRLKLV